jgi:perosamine synthetase
MIQARDVPRLPVLDWWGGGTDGIEVQSILDDSDYVFTTSGRAAIMLGLESLGISKGDQVLVPTYHCPTMISPVTAIGAEPLFYPINDQGEALLQSLEFSEPWKVKAAIVPHLFGIPQNLTKVRDFCTLHQIALIEDCAHCFFGIDAIHAVGHWGDLTIASLPKFFPVPSGGVLAFPPGKMPRFELRSPALIKEILAIVDIIETAVSFKRLRGITSVLGAMFFIKRIIRQSPPITRPIIKISDAISPDVLEFDSFLARQALERICQFVPKVSDRRRIAERRRDNYQILAEVLSGYNGFAPLFPKLPNNAVPYVFPLHVDKPDPKYHKLKNMGLPIFRWNWLWPGTPVIAGDFGPKWSSEIFQLACHQNLTNEELQCICSTVISVCSSE